MTNFKKGFTLAEVLVTLAIIGVVSALTVPGLMNSYQKQTYVTQLHKFYNEMTQALTQYKTDKNALNLKEAGFTSQANVNTFVETYFKVINSCDQWNPCFEDISTYKYLSGGSIGNRANPKSYTLASGASIRPYYYVEGEKLINLFVDINGPKGPNILGRDLFFMGIYSNGMIDDFYNSATNAPLSTTMRETVYAGNCQSGGNVYGCFGKILNDNWQMTY